MLTEILEMVSGCSTQIVGEGESPSVLIWKGESGRTHFCGPNRKSYFQYLSPLKLKTETYSASETRFFRRRIISTRSVTNIYFVRCAFSCTCWGGGWGEARRSQFSRFWIWKNFCKISLGGGSTHGKSSTYRGEKKNTKSSNMNQLVFEPTIPTFEVQNIVNALHTTWPWVAENYFA